MDTLSQIITLPKTVCNALSKQSLYEHGIHDNIESTHVSEGRCAADTATNGCRLGRWAAEYTVIVGSGGLFPVHSHIPVLVDKKNIILTHIGHDYEPYYRFSFTMEDTLFHSHAANHVYYCMDDDEGGVALYGMDLTGYEFGGELCVPEMCYRAIGDMVHSHTITLVRHAVVAVVGDDSSVQSITASGAVPTTP